MPARDGTRKMTHHYLAVDDRYARWFRLTPRHLWRRVWKQKELLLVLA